MGLWAKKMISLYLDGDEVFVVERKLSLARAREILYARSLLNGDKKKRKFALDIT
jgi:hypothetical protein